MNNINNDGSVPNATQTDSKVALCEATANNTLSAEMKDLSLPLHANIDNQSSNDPMPQTSLLPQFVPNTIATTNDAAIPKGFKNSGMKIS